MPRFVIFANGELSASETKATLARLQKGDILIAADGGARHVEALGLVADVLIGDMDSVDPKTQSRLAEGKTAIVSFPREKDETDLELALLYAVNQGACAIAIVAALGGRLDMTEANLALLHHPALANIAVQIWMGTQTACLVNSKGITWHGAAGDTLSLIARQNDAQGVRTQGLLYPLQNETLYLGLTRGLSNRMMAQTARIDLETGSLLLVHIPAL